MLLRSSSRAYQVNLVTFGVTKQRIRQCIVHYPRRRLDTRLHRRIARPLLAVSRASASGPADNLPIKSSGQLGLWTAIDAAATIGSIVGALAFIVTSEAILVGIPVVLPLVAWYAGRQKEGLQIEVSSTLPLGLSAAQMTTFACALCLFLAIRRSSQIDATFAVQGSLLLAI